MSFTSSGGLGPTSEAAANALAWLDEATDGASRLRAPLRIEIVRSLTPEDVASGFLVPAPPPTLREIKASHHALAKVLASGRSHIEASRITGYSVGYISRLVGDPGFREVLAHYGEVEELAGADYLGAMRAVGMDLLDELRKRIEEDPTAFSVGQLHEGIKLLLVEPMKSEAMRAGGGSGGGGVAPIRISFVTSETPQAGAGAEVEDARVIEGNAKEIE